MRSDDAEFDAQPAAGADDRPAPTRSAGFTLRGNPARPGGSRPDPNAEAAGPGADEADQDLNGFEPPLWEPPIDEDERFKDFG